MGQTTFSGPVRSLAGFNPSGFDNVVVIDSLPSFENFVLSAESHGGRLCVLDGTDMTGYITIPNIITTAPTPPSTVESPDQKCNLGLTFRFFYEVAATNVVFRVTLTRPDGADDTDRFCGEITIHKDGVGLHHTFFAATPPTSFDQIATNGTTTGGAIYSYVEMTATRCGWYVSNSVLLGSGLLATPFA